jgi:hypothetical protein
MFGYLLQGIPFIVLLIVHFIIACSYTLRLGALTVVADLHANPVHALHIHTLTMFTFIALVVLQSVVILPALGLILLVLVLTVAGKSLGIRRRYVQLLIRLFEVCMRPIVHAMFAVGSRLGAS